MINQVTESVQCAGCNGQTYTLVGCGCGGKPKTKKTCVRCGGTGKMNRVRTISAEEVGKDVIHSSGKGSGNYIPVRDFSGNVTHSIEISLPRRG